MAKTRRRSAQQRIQARENRSLEGHARSLGATLAALAAEHERRDFWLRLGAHEPPRQG